jgi:hypothetical protein
MNDNQCRRVIFIFQEGVKKMKNYEIGLTGEGREKPPNQHYANVCIDVPMCVSWGRDSNRLDIQKG